MHPLNDILDQDLDPTETQEWTESLRAVIDSDGAERAHYILQRMVESGTIAFGLNPLLLAWLPTVLLVAVLAALLARADAT